LRRGGRELARNQERFPAGVCGTREPVSMLSYSILFILFFSGVSAGGLGVPDALIPTAFAQLHQVERSVWAVGCTASGCCRPGRGAVLRQGPPRCLGGVLMFWFQRPAARRQRSPRPLKPRLPLSLEVLEDRTLLSYFLTIDSPTGGTTADSTL